MKTNRQRCLVFALATLLLGVGTGAADDWSARADQPPAGISRGRWQHLIGHLREKPYSVAEIQPCLVALRSAYKESLPIEAVLVRLEEGAVKKADSALLGQVVQQRVASLRSARELLATLGTGADSCAELVISVSSALESGVPADGLLQAIALGDGLRVCRLKTVVEAGESLKLLGLDDATVAGLMEDFVRHELCCGEILRAVGVAGDQHRENLSGLQIREALATTLAARETGTWRRGGDCEGRQHRRGGRGVAAPRSPAGTAD